MTSSYQEFLKAKTPDREAHGFKPLWMPDFLFDFQKELTEWAIQIGRCALFEDCGLGKSPQELVWAENIVRKTNGNVLFLTPLAVGAQMVREAEKFGIKVTRSRDGRVHKGINITNYQQLGKYSPKDFKAVVLDESSIVKNFEGKTRKAVTEFMGQVEYRLLASATPAPNDFMELGNSSEALGVMGRNQMLGMFFTNDGESTQQWRLKGHAKKRFWQWMAGWARAIRKPSDLGYPDNKFILPALEVNRLSVESRIRKGFFPELARSLNEQRKEKRSSLMLRCEAAASCVPKNAPCLLWCQLNDEGDTLEKLIPDAVQVKGSDSDDKKEKLLNTFSTGQVRVLVTKPSIACFGLNWQHCADVVYFPSHSHEQYYQAIRRCWRFGQKKPVKCNLVYSEAEELVVKNMLRKERQSVELYDGVLREMNNVLRQEKTVDPETNGKVEIPSWLISR